jgi:hypothetical protein
MQAKTKNRLTIIFTVLLFTAPVVVAYLLSSGLLNYHPDSTKNNGTFVSPLVKLADWTDAPWAAQLEGHWTLIRRVPGACPDGCEEAQDALQRYRLSLGHRAEKLNLMLMTDQPVTVKQDLFPLVSKVSIQGNAGLQQEMQRLSAESLGDGQGLYVVAPEGYLMMAFTAENTSSEIIKDLSLLTKRKGD